LVPQGEYISSFFWRKKHSINKNKITTRDLKQISDVTICDGGLNKEFPCQILQQGLGIKKVCSKVNLVDLLTSCLSLWT
jgi:hypothetical protein